MKTIPIIVLPKAERDLEEQYNYISCDSLSAAKRYYGAVDKTFEQLAAMPGIGGYWDPHHPRLFDLRIWPVRGFHNFLIFYRLYKDRLEIVRILQGARDLPIVLEEHD
jgi:toxin ParE1/3/4